MKKQLAIGNSRFLTTQSRLIAEKSTRVRYETFLRDSFQNQKRRIYELTDERIIQEGRHEELLKDEGGRYAALWNALARYYQGGD